MPVCIVLLIVVLPVASLQLIVMLFVPVVLRRRACMSLDA